MKHKFKIPFNADIGLAFSKWLKARDIYAACSDKDACWPYFEYEKACMELRQRLREHGYSKNAVDDLLTDFQEHVNHAPTIKAP